MAFITGTAAPSTGLVEKLAAFRAWLGESRRTRAIYRQTIDELSALSDRELADLGLHRSQIRTVAQQAAKIG
jgi:uncharacterized protein YjiS (DUF1127 family)